jgi:hypothetical protein
VGKGENQTEIDFVVQQYREYFAASYLTNHPDAEPEKVFSMLINRGAYWSYVLQFYFAQATSNQQIRWLNDVESIDEKIERTKACRAIMNTLPELNDSLKMKHFELALKIIFYKETRWTWRLENSAIDILKNTRSGSALPVILKWLDSLSIEDQQTLETELWLLGQVFSLGQQEEQLTLFENNVQELLENESTRDNALISALENDLKINLSSLDILEFQPTLLRFYHESILNFNKKTKALDNFIQSQNSTKLCELMFCFPLWEFTQTPLPFFTQQELLSIFISEDREYLRIFEGRKRLSLKYYLVKKDLSLEKPLSEDEADIHNVYFTHLKNLFHVVLNSSNYELNIKARESEKRISSPNLWGWRIDNILGPDLSVFNSMEDWKFFKKEIVDISTQDKDWIANSADFNSISNLWLVLFFHPRYWPLLVTESLITDHEYQTLLHSKLAIILNTPKIPINLFRGRYLSDDKPVIPLLRILNIAITIAIQDGVKYLGNAEGLYTILWRCHIEPVTSEDVNDLLTKSKKLDSLPSVWAGAMLYLCLNSPSLNLDLFLEFWEINQDKMIHTIPDFDHILNKTDLLEELLAKNQKNALTLAAVLMIKEIKIDPSTQDKLYDKLLNEFNNNNFNSKNDIMTLYLALLKLNVKIEEFSAWHCQDVINEIAKSVFSLDELCKRFLSLSNPNNPGFALDYKLLREALMVFITHRKDYPSTLVLSALETILKIDEANLSPLQDQDWQRSDD